jgi:hypothetical protein
LALKDPTAVAFRRQHGSNLLIVGQQDETALGLMATAAIGLAGHACAARFYVVDASQAGRPSATLLARLADLLPQSLKATGWRNLPALLAELSEELERRRQTPEADDPDVYLLLYGLHRCRDLRRQEDDFGFMARGEGPPNPVQQFATLLREGPPVGIHTLLWCDTLTNLQRSLDRQALRELSLRVVFQMSVADSSNLIDTPLAAKLGLHRALLASEEDGRMEKFRPYGLPSEEWLERVKKRLRAKAEAKGGA